MHRWYIAVIAALSIGIGCQRSAQPLRVDRFDTPIPPGAIVPQTTRMGTRDIVVSWLEPRTDRGYRFRAALRHGGNWSDPITIDDSTDIAMFTADLPGIAELPHGAWLAYWERRDQVAKDDATATVIKLARSSDAGKTWTALPPPHRDGTSGQHSFLSTFTVGEDLGLIWLDGEHQRHVQTAASGTKPASEQYLGSIGLRYASFRADGEQNAEAFIDPITCECCPTSAAVTARGPVIVYRDRMTPAGTRPEDIRYETPTVRDIYLARLENGQWTEPRRVHADNWVFNGCPDNGPAVDASGNHVAVAWWTGAGDELRVLVAFSDDAGEHFGSPIRVDAKDGEGQVTVALAQDGRAAIVGWLENHETRARWVDADGHAEPSISLGYAPRHSRLPRWIAMNNGALATWTDETNGVRTVRMAQLTR